MTRATSPRARPRSLPGYVRAVRRLVGAVLDGLERRRRRRTSTSSPRPSRELLPSHSVCRERIRGGPDSPSSSPATPIAVDAAGRHHRLRAVQRGGRDAGAQVEALQRVGVGVGADQPVEPADRTDEPGSASSTSSIAAKCERFGAGSPVACTAASLPAVQSGSSGASAGCRPNMPSLASSTSDGDGDVGPGGVVGRVGVRDDQRQAVGRPAQRQHDQHRGRGRGGGRRTRSRRRSRRRSSTPPSGERAA